MEYTISHPRTKQMLARELSAGEVAQWLLDEIKANENKIEVAKIICKKLKTKFRLTEFSLLPKPKQIDFIETGLYRLVDIDAIDRVFEELLPLLFWNK